MRKAIRRVDWTRKVTPLAIGVQFVYPINDYERGRLWTMIVQGMEELNIGTPFVPPIFVGFGEDPYPEHIEPSRRGFYHCHFELKKGGN